MIQIGNEIINPKKVLSLEQESGEDYVTILLEGDNYFDCYVSLTDLCKAMESENIKLLKVSDSSFIVEQKIATMEIGEEEVTVGFSTGDVQYYELDEKFVNEFSKDFTQLKPMQPEDVSHDLYYENESHDGKKVMIALLVVGIVCLVVYKVNELGLFK